MNNRTIRPTKTFASVALLALLALSAAPLVAQEPERPVHEGAARVFAIRPHAGMERQFEDGYRRHLDWHRQAGDPWAWYLWQVTNGERAGLYVDGTFEHRWSDFDAAVDPAGDGADNDVNVEPFAARPWNAAWRRLGATDGDFAALAERSRYLLVVEYRLRPDSAARVFDALDRARAVHPVALSSGTGDPASSPAWFALASGGEGPALVLVAPLPRWSGMSPLAPDPLLVALEALEPARRDGDASRLYRAITSAATSVRSEIWRFRPDLSVCRDAATHCHATVAARAVGADR
ncbi:MAG TPA: hypothetical protein VF041_14495 [Gemmatimonadaceae bacterium]